MKIIYYRLITYVLTAALLYPDIVLALPNTLHPNSAFDADPRNNKARSEMIEYLSVKSTSDKVYKEARLAQRLYEMGYVEGTGEENKYIRPTRELLKLWEDAMTKELSSVFVKGYLIKLDKLGKNWEVARISNQTTGEEEVYQFGVYQRTEVKVVKDKGKAPPAVKKKEAEDEPQKPGLMQQILIAFSQLARPTLRELMEFIRDEWGTETDEKGVLTRIGFLNFRRRKAGQKELVLVSEEEKAKEMEEPEPAEPAKPKKPLRSVKPTKPARPPKPEKPPKPASPPAKKDKGELLRKLAELNWNLKKFHDYITAITGRKKPHFLELLRELDLAEEFKKRCREVYIEKRGTVQWVAEYFGITSTTLRALIADFEIDLDIPEPEEQKGFNRIVLSYAEELKKGTPIEGIKEKLGPLVEGFTGWEVDAEEGEIKTKFMGNNTLVMGALEDKRYRIVFEWHVEFGLVVILKEPGRDDSEDIVYDLSNCRDFDGGGQHKKINALWKGKRKDFKGIDLNRIIERYTRLLKEGRTLPEIREILLKQIEEFGSWEIEVARRNFAITPIHSIYNNLVFDHLPSGKLFLKLQWDDLIGLMVTFGKSEDDSSEDLIFDVNTFSDFDESSTRDKPKNIFAKKIGKRDELNRARLNKVILRYINLLKDGKPLEQIREEMAEEMELLGYWQKTLESPQFTTTPVVNNVLGFQNIPKGTYEISLEWLDPIGLVAVFHKEGEDGSDDLLYDINPYKDYNESAEKSTHINARKLGVRKIITAAYLEGLKTIVRAGKLDSEQKFLLNYLGEIILKYIDYLREGKSSDEINGLLAEDIEKFGIRELELNAKSFSISPVKLNSLLFLGLSPGEYYISVFWHDEYGLLVGLKPQDESDKSMKTQIYDVSPYKNYGSTEKERQQLVASTVTSRLISIREEKDKIPQALATVISKEDAKRLLEGAEINWNLMKFHDHIAGIVGRKRIPLLELLRELDLADEFKKRCREVYIEKGGVIEKVAEYFGIKYNTLRTLIGELGIDLDIPVPEEQKGFNRIVLGYAQELKKGTLIEGIKEKLGPLIEGFSGWEVDAEKGEIKTKFMGNNILVIAALKDKRYKIVFEWHKDFGLVVVLKEPGRGEGEDLIYDLSNCRDYDERGQYKRINALWKGKRKDFKGMDLNGIIERYARLFREGKSLPEIKEVLQNSIEGFGSWELKKTDRSFITTPISGSYNKLGFDRLPLSELFLRLQWDELVGLVVVFGKEREDSSEDLLYDPSPYAEFDESATDDNPKNIYAQKIGVRDELNRARLNKVILRYADLLRAGRPLEEIREEIREMMSLLGSWKKDVTGVSFTTTPVNNNTLHVQSLPKGIYDVTLEWIDFFGMALVFSKGENREEDLIYSINNYKDYDVTRESFTFINATKLGERKWLPLRYLEKLILRYTDYLKEGKSLDEIRWILAGDMEIFAVRELELGSKTFWVDPVKGNRLYFRGLLPGQYYVTLGWHKDYGLIVTLIAKDKGNKTQVYYINKQEDGRFNVEIVTSKVKDTPTAQDVIDLEGQLFLKNEIREGTRAKLGERNCIIYGSPVLLPDAKLYLQFTDGKIEGYTIREIIETLQIYSERQRKWLLLKGWVKMPEERAPAGEGREETMEEPRYPTLTRLTRLRDPQGRSYILMGRRYKDTDEVLLAPENILVLKPEDGGEIVRITVKDAIEAGWEGLEVSLTEALRELDAFLNQTSEVLQPEFTGFGWEEGPGREFLQGKLPEILRLAQDEEIVARRLPDGRLRFTKVVEHYSIRDGISIEQVYTRDWQDIKGEILRIQDVLPGQLRQSKRDLAMSFRDKKAISFVAKKEGRIIGYVTGARLEDFGYIPGVKGFEDFGFGNTFYIEQLVVQEDSQTEVVRDLLFNEIVSRAKEKGYQFLTGHTPAGTAPKDTDVIGVFRDFYKTGITYIQYRFILNPIEDTGDILSDIAIRRKLQRVEREIAERLGDKSGYNEEEEEEEVEWQSVKDIYDEIFIFENLFGSNKRLIDIAKKIYFYLRPVKNVLYWIFEPAEFLLIAVIFFGALNSKVISLFIIFLWYLGISLVLWLSGKFHPFFGRLSARIRYRHIFLLIVLLSPALRQEFFNILGEHETLVPVYLLTFLIYKPLKFIEGAVQGMEVKYLLRFKHYRKEFNAHERTIRTRNKMVKMGLNEFWDNPDYKRVYRAEGKEIETRAPQPYQELARQTIRKFLGYIGEDGKPRYDSESDYLLKGRKTAIMIRKEFKEYIELIKNGRATRDNVVYLFSEIREHYVKPGSDGVRVLDELIENIAGGAELLTGEVQAEIWQRDPYVDLSYNREFNCCAFLGGIKDQAVFGYMDNPSITMLDFRTPNKGRIARVIMGAGTFYEAKVKRTVLVVDSVEGTLSLDRRLIRQAIEDYARAVGFHAVMYNNNTYNAVPKGFLKYLKGQGVPVTSIEASLFDYSTHEYFESFNKDFARPRGTVSGYFVRLNRPVPVREVIDGGNFIIEQVFPEDWQGIRKEIMEVEKVFPRSLRQDKEDLSNTFEDPDSITLIVKSGDEIIGYIAGGPLEDYNYLPGIEKDSNYGKNNTVYIESFAVVKGYQGRGLGSRLRARFLELAKGRGYEYVSGHVRKGVAEKRGDEILSIHRNWRSTRRIYEYYRRRLEGQGGPTHSKAPKGSPPFTEADRRELARMNKDASFFLLSKTQPGFFSAVKESIRGSYVLGDGQEIRIDRRKLKDIKIIYGGTDSLDILNFGFRVNEKIGFSYYELDKKTRDVTVVLPFLFFASVFKKYMDLKEEHYFAGKRKMVKVRKWEQDIPIAILRQAVLHEMVEARNPNVDEHAVAEAVEVSDTIILEEKMRARYKKKGMDYPYSDLVKKTMGGTPLSLLDQEIDEVCPVLIEKGDVIRLWEKCKWDLDSLRQELGISGIGFRLEGIERMPGVEESIVADSYIAFIRGVGIEEEFKKKLIEVFRKKKKQTKREKEDCLSELAMFFGLYATQVDVLLKIMLRLDIEGVLKEIIGMGRQKLLKSLEAHRWDSNWPYKRFEKRLNEWGLVNIFGSPGKVIEVLDLIDFYRDRHVYSMRWWSMASEHRKFVDEHVGRTRAEVEEYFDKLFRKWNYSIRRAREYSLKNLYVPGKGNIFKIIKIFRLEGFFKKIILRFWQENDFNNIDTAIKLDIGSTVIGSLMAASGISDLSVLTGVGSVDYLKKRLKKLRKEKLIGLLEEGRKDAQEAFRELIKEGVLDKYLRLFGLSGTYRLIYRIFKEKLSEEELYSLMRNYLVSLDLGDVEKGFGRERREFSFVSAREVEIPRSMDRTELDILTDEVITSVYKNLIRDPRFLERLKEESQNEQNPEPLREAYARAYKYYKDAIGFEVKGLRPDVVLRLFQKIGVKFLIERKKAVLADEMGTGKTIQAIAACLNIPAQKVLVIVPNSAKDVWEKEIRTKTKERAAILRSGKREEFFSDAKDARFLVVNYEAIGRKDRTLLDRLKAINFDVIIYDEAHKLRNENLYWRAVKEFNAEYEFGLTGTPLVGRDIMKSFNLNHKLYPERFPSRRGYKAKYSYSRREADVERVYYRIRQYHTDVKDFTLRRLKKDVLPDLPPKRFITVPVRLSPEHREAYERIYRNFREWLNQYVRKEKRPEKPIILSKYLRLKQAAIDLSLVEERDMPSAKYEELDRLIETIMARGEKALVYSTYVGVVDKLKERYKDRGVCCLKGGMSNVARLRQIDMFQSDPHKRIMVSTFTESVTLTAANNVIFIDKPWTAQDRDQAIDRVHRFGQTRPVNIYTLLAEDTVDERTERILQEGEVLFKLAIEDFGDVSSAEEEVISGIMKEEKEVKNLVDYLRDRYAEFQRISEAGKRGVKSFNKIKEDGLSIYIDDKGALVMSLEKKDGAGIKIIGFKGLLQAAGTLSSKSKGLIKEFFRKRLEYETAGNISIKDSFLWPLFVELVPVVGQIDFHGQLEFEVELSVYVIFSLINNENISPGDLLVQKYKSDIDLNKVLYMLDRYNIFKALSELGVLSSDFYYLGNILDYKHPSQSFSLEAVGLYHDKDIVDAIGMVEMRLAREANKGNVSARDAIISANLWLVKEVAKGEEELIAEGNKELVAILGDYLKRYKEISFAEYARPLISEALSRYSSARRREMAKELAILDVPVFEDDERETRKDRLVYTGEAEEVDEEPELIRLARERLAEEGFSNEEIEIFLKSVAGYETDELAIEYSRDTAEIEEIIQRARETLAKVQRLKEAVREAVPARREVWIEGDYGVTRKEEPEEAIPVREPRERTRGEPFARQKTMIRLQKAKDFLLAHSDVRLEFEAHPKRGHIIKLIIEHRIMNMDRTLKELGEMAGVTKERIRQIEKWILDFVDERIKAGQCVTGDTILPVVRGRVKGIPIVDVRPGDYVLSLNEETQQIEPHRIKGLLDMGVKPVYKMTTTSGRSIKTTANHPYLTNDGWVKVSRLGAGDKIAVPSGHGNGAVYERDTGQSPRQSGERLQMLITLIEQLEPYFQSLSSFLLGGGQLINPTIPDNSATKKITTFTNRLNSWKKPLTQPAIAVNLNISKNVFEIMSRRFLWNMGILLNKVYYAVGFVSRCFLAEAEAAETDGDIFWDRIVSIEYLGLEHVYDIEVEGTHNFIGNGIFAHNTHIGGVGGQKIEKSFPAGVHDSKMPGLEELQWTGEGVMLDRDVIELLINRFRDGVLFDEVTDGYSLSLFIEENLSSVKLRQLLILSFISLLNKLKDRPELAGLFFNEILGIDANTGVKICIRAAKNLPVNSLRYYDKKRGLVVIAIDSRFLDALLRYWDEEGYRDVIEWFLTERVFIHELSHDNRMSSRKEELREEAGIIRTKDLVFYREICYKDPEFIRRIDRFRIQTGVSEAARSGKYFGFLHSLADVTEGRLAERIRRYVRRNYLGREDISPDLKAGIRLRNRLAEMRLKKKIKGELTLDDMARLLDVEKDDEILKTFPPDTRFRIHYTTLYIFHKADGFIRISPMIKLRDPVLNGFNDYRVEDDIKYENRIRIRIYRRDEELNRLDDLQKRFQGMPKDYLGILYEVNEREEVFSGLGNEELRYRVMLLRDRISGGERIEDVLVEALVLFRVASRRAIEMRPYDEQVLGAIGMIKNNAVQMLTGEGKTLAIAMASFVMSLVGEGVHIATFNEYLAKRDILWMGPIFDLLGVKAGLRLDRSHSYLYSDKFNTNGTRLKRALKRDACLADITYGSANVFVFDFEQDSMALNPEEKAQRELSFAIVDEGDSILIDEAFIPLSLSSQIRQFLKKTFYYEMAGLANRLVKGVHYNVDIGHRSVSVVKDAIKELPEYQGLRNRYKNIPEIIFENCLRQALRAKELVHLDEDYIIEDGRLVIIDTFTGRPRYGYIWGEGLHQAVEAKEALAYITFISRSLATMTKYRYFRMYRNLSCTSGTLGGVKHPLSRWYRLNTIEIPPNKPVQRKEYPSKWFKTKEEKFRAVAEEVERMRKKGRPVLVGTRTIKDSETLSRLLSSRHIPHKVLNGRNLEEEAEIVAQAGQAPEGIGNVTIVTNLAGRGTDIKLGAGVNERGGLHVIGTEYHENIRVDDQLRGRAARQGDNGSCRFFLAKGDYLIKKFIKDSQHQVVAINKMRHNAKRDLFIRARLDGIFYSYQARFLRFRKGFLNVDILKKKTMSALINGLKREMDGKECSNRAMDVLIEVLALEEVGFKQIPGRKKLVRSVGLGGKEKLLEMIDLNYETFLFRIQTLIERLNLIGLGEEDKVGLFTEASRWIFSKFLEELEMDISGSETYKELAKVGISLPKAKLRAFNRAKEFLEKHPSVRSKLEENPRFKLIIEHRIIGRNKTLEQMASLLGVTSREGARQIENRLVRIIDSYGDAEGPFDETFEELSANKRTLNEKTLELLTLQNTVIELDYPSGMAGFLYFDVDKLLSESRETAQAYVRALVSLLKTGQRTKNFTVVLVNSHCDWSFQDIIGVLKTRHLDGIDYLIENALIVDASETGKNIGSILIERAYNKARRRLGKVPQNIILAIFRNNLDLYPVDLLRRYILLILSPQKSDLDVDEIKRLSPYLPGLKYDKETPLLPEIFCTSSEYQTALEAERRIRSQA